MEEVIGQCRGCGSLFTVYLNPSRRAAAHAVQQTLAGPRYFTIEPASHFTWHDGALTHSPPAHASAPRDAHGRVQVCQGRIKLLSANTNHAPIPAPRAEAINVLAILELHESDLSTDFERTGTE